MVSSHYRLATRTLCHETISLMLSQARETDEPFDATYQVAIDASRKVLHGCLDDVSDGWLAEAADTMMCINGPAVGAPLSKPPGVQCEVEWLRHVKVRLLEYYDIWNDKLVLRFDARVDAPDQAWVAA